MNLTATKEEPPAQFLPVTLTFKCETQNELDDFAGIFNNGPLEMWLNRHKIAHNQNGTPYYEIFKGVGANISKYPPELNYVMWLFGTSSRWTPSAIEHEQYAHLRRAYGHS